MTQDEKIHAVSVVGRLLMRLDYAEPDVGFLMFPDSAVRDAATMLNVTLDESEVALAVKRMNWKR